MSSCRICSSGISPDKRITCSGSCGLSFHHSCVGLTKTQLSSWTANVGFYWFCSSCRLNFDPAVHDREKVIFKALRELLIRTDSMDTRLGNYGESLRKMNKALYDSQQRTPPANLSLDHTTFHQTIDMMTLDDTVSDVPMNRSRSCDDTSFFEVLDEINATVSQAPEKFVVGGNKRVQIVTNPMPSTSKSTNKRDRASTPAVPSQKNEQVLSKSDSISVDTDQSSSRERENVPRRPSAGPLSVARIGAVDEDSTDFYVTPFTPDQKEEDVLTYLQDITNVNPATVKVVKLVPRGKTLNDLTFVSFKVTVNKSISNVIGDPWYWPDGVTVRIFDHTPKNNPPPITPARL